MTTTTFTSPRHAEIVDILKSASKGMTSREIFAKAKGFEDADEVSKALNYMAKKGQVEREKIAQNTYCYWLTSSKASDIGNTLLRIGEDDPMPASPVRAVINDALKPCPEIDAVTQEMANQAEIAYQVLSEALGLTPEQMSDLTLADLASMAAARLEDQPPPADAVLLASANRMLSMRIAEVIEALHKAPVPFADAIDNDQHLVSNIEAIIAELIGEQVRGSIQTELLGKICHTLDISLYSTSTEILAEVENLSRLAGRATHAPAKPAPSGPYIIISGAHGTHENIDEARRLAERAARHSTLGRSLIVSVVAEVELVPQWSDAKC